MFENLSSYEITLYILIAVAVIWLVFKAISLLFKLFILAATCAVLYFSYGYYPTETLTASGILLGMMIMLYIVKFALFNKKDKK